MVDQTISNVIKEHDVISFDVFDTLIKRNVKQQKDIFQIVENRYFTQFQFRIQFGKHRKAAEKKARTRYGYSEVNLDEIYIELANNLGEVVANNLKKLEIETEVDFICRNKEVFELFELCKRLKKTIYIISDMYLTSDIVIRMLDKCGYCGYDKVYVSCEYRKTKWQGGLLYQAILSLNNLSASDILHIGNDKIADFIMAKKQGLSAILISENDMNSRYDNSYGLKSNHLLTYNCVEKFISNHFIGKFYNDDYKIGYEVFGPLLYGYLEWLKQQLVNLNITQVFFFSRDGYILKKGFELLNSDINDTYFYASRRSIISSLYQYDRTLEDMMKHFKSWPKSFSLIFLLRKIGIDSLHFCTLLNKYDLKKDDIYTYEQVVNDINLNKFFCEVTPYIIDTSLKNSELLKQYMMQEGMRGRIAMVDIGAGCSIEIALRDFIKKSELPIELFSLYVATNQEENFYRKRFIDTGNKDVKVALRFCYMLLEVFLSAPHGTVLGYKLEHQKIVPHFEKYAYDVKGNVDEPKMIKTLHEGALQFLQDFDRELGGKISLNEKEAVKNFMNFGVMPQVEDARRWALFRFDSDQFKSLAKYRGIKNYVKKPFSFLHDFSDSMWPAGFLMINLKKKFLNRFIFQLYRLVTKIR